MRKKVCFAIWAIVFASGIFGIVQRADAQSTPNFDQNCTSCHYHTTASLAGRTALQIQNAINNVNAMSGIKNSLTSAQIATLAAAVAAELAPPPAADTTGPSLTITSHTSGQHVSTSTITLSGTATDSGKGNSGIQQVTVNGTAASGGTASTSGTASWSMVVSLASGANAFTVVAYDNSTNHNPTTGPAMTIYYDPPVASDTTPPSLAIMSHTNGQHVGTSSIILTGTASDAGKGDSGIQQVTVNGSPASGGTASTSGTASWSTAVSLAAGVNTVTVVAYDNSSNHNATTAPTMTIYYDPPPTSDTTPPSLAITSHADGQHVSTSNITLIGTASDAGKGDSGIQQVTVNGSPASGGTVSGNGTAYWIMPVSLVSGANAFTVVAYDNSTNHNTTAGPAMTIYYDPPVASDTTPPSLAITSHTNGQHVGTSSIILTGTASDAGKGDSGIQQVTVNGSPASGGTASTSGTASWSTAVSLAAGANPVTVVAYDNSSNHNATTAPAMTIYYDPPPASDTTPPSLAITSHTNGQHVSTPSITLTGTASDAGKGDSGIQQVTVNGSPASGGTASTSEAASWSTAVSLVAGANTVTVVAYDNSTNHNTITQSLTINCDGATATPPPDSPSGLGNWVNQWFKVTLKNEGYHVGKSANAGNQESSESGDQSPGMSRDHGNVVGYLKISSLSTDGKTLQADLYTADGKGGWLPESFSLHYIGGSDLNFLSKVEVTGDSNTSCVIRIAGRQTNGVLHGATLKTLGGYYVETSEASGSAEYWAGEFSMNGSLIPESRVPVPRTAVVH